MEKINPRQLIYIKFIIKWGFFRNKEPSNEFSIGDKTIYREVTAINNCLKKYKVNVYNFDNQELVISGKRNVIENLKESIEKIPIQWILNKHQRQIMILTELLLKGACKSWLL